MPPRITRLYANNYRCLVNFELRPERRALLIGYNPQGAGNRRCSTSSARSGWLIPFNTGRRTLSQPTP